MTVAREIFTNYAKANPESLALLGARAVFRARPQATAKIILDQLERRERIVLLLLDGRHTIGDVERLTHYSNEEVLHTLGRFLKYGYVEYLGVQEEIRHAG
jgi:hypothetical protein